MQNSGQGNYYPPPNAPYNPSYNPSYNPGPSQPYAPSSTYPPKNESYVPPQTQDTPRFESQGLNDVFFLLLFVAQLLGFLGWSGYVLYNWVKSGGNGGGGLGNNSGSVSFTLDQHTAYLLLLITGCALLLSIVYLIIVRAFTKIIMHITLILSILLNIGIAAYLWYEKYYSGAIVATIFAVLGVLGYWAGLSRIPLASLLLQIVMDIAKHHPAVYIVAFVSLFLSAGLSTLYNFAVIATYGRYHPGEKTCTADNSCSSAIVTGMTIYLTFSFLWTSQVVGNMALATLAGGPFGSWYYLGPKNSAGTGMGSHTTINSLGRAFKSMGSIAFGSLIVTILEMIKMLMHALRNSAQQDDQPLLALLACCAECFIGCIEGMVEYFNRYAYIEIALYGKGYITAAKDTWRLLQDRGLTALVNDSLVNMALTWGAYAVGILCTLFAYLYLRYTHPAYNESGNYTPVVMLFGFLIGFMCSITMTSALEAGVSTIFVGLAEDPEVLAIRAPELFAMIAERYPQVVEGVNQ
ncbi:DUF580-domain-containing protein [Clavulina sp. PMI_390]|nr:DUF580-domain-containing protein [Clavulina sp. PMI_390]